MILTFAFFAPAIMIVVAIAVYLFAKQGRFGKPSAVVLFRLTVMYALVGGGLSLVLTVAWMFWYEATSGYSAGNAPLAWIFVYGPLSVALGQVLALVVWWFRKAKDSEMATTA